MVNTTNLATIDGHSEQTTPIGSSYHSNFCPGGIDIPGGQITPVTEDVRILFFYSCLILRCGRSKRDIEGFILLIKEPCEMKNNALL